MKSVVVTSETDLAGKHYYQGATRVTDAESAVLVAAGKLTGDPVDLEEPVDPAAPLSPATADEVDDGTDDRHYVTPKSLEDSSIGDDAISPEEVLEIAQEGKRFYKARLEQTGAFAPSMTMDTNDLEAVPVISRISEGLYQLEITGAFTELKTNCLACFPDFDADAPFAWFTRVGDDTIQIRTGTAKDALVELEGTLYLEIVVNP